MQIIHKDNIVKIMLLPAILLSATLLNATSNKEIKQEAKDAITKLKNTLQTHLKENLKKGGVSQAADFCSTKAQAITHEINVSFAKETTIHRISLKYRNSVNSPKTDERKVLQSMQKDFDAGKALPDLLVKKIHDNTYKVYKPIYISKGVCLKCHGDVSKLDKKAYSSIGKNYPNDKALNYKMGDLRGAFVVKIVER